jgi:hypothetical protein
VRRPDYFELQLARAHEVLRDALARVAGHSGTVRGSFDEHDLRKVVVHGTTEALGRTRAPNVRHSAGRSFTVEWSSRGERI